MIDGRLCLSYPIYRTSAPNELIKDDSLDVGTTDGFVWIRLNGKGSFSTSPALKGFVESRMEGGDTSFVIDLLDCPAMDSTFMGTLAGLAMRLSRIGGGRMHLNGVCDRNRQSLEDLGLEKLLEIDPDNSAWQGHVHDVRKTLSPLQGRDSEGLDAAHLLEAHRKLCEAREENTQKFEAVLDALEKKAEGG